MNFIHLQADIKTMHLFNNSMNDKVKTESYINFNFDKQHKVHFPHSRDLKNYSKHCNFYTIEIKISKRNIPKYQLKSISSCN